MHVAFEQRARAHEPRQRALVSRCDAAAQLDHARHRLERVRDVRGRELPQRCGRDEGDHACIVADHDRDVSLVDIDELARFELLEALSVRVCAVLMGPALGAQAVRCRVRLKLQQVTNGCFTRAASVGVDVTGEDGGKALPQRKRLAVAPAEHDAIVPLHRVHEHDRGRLCGLPGLAVAEPHHGLALVLLVRHLDGDLRRGARVVRAPHLLHDARVVIDVLADLDPLTHIIKGFKGTEQARQVVRVLANREAVAI